MMFIYQRSLFITCFVGALILGFGAFADEAAIAEPEPEQTWESDVALGFNLTTGNSDTALFTLQYKAKREWEKDIWSLGAHGSYGEDDGTKNNERAGAHADYQHLISEHTYGGANLTLLHDAIANLEFHANLGPVVGHYFIKNDTTSLSGEIGPSFIVEKLDVDQPGVPAPNNVNSEWKNYFALRAGEKFEHQLSETAKIWQSLEFLPQIDDFGNFIILAEIGAEAALNSQMSLRVVVSDRYDNDVASGTKKNDLSLVSSLVYRF